MPKKAMSVNQMVFEMHTDIKEIKEKLIPDLRIDMAVEKEKNSRSAKVIAGVGGILAIAVSTAVAWLKK